MDIKYSCRGERTSSSEQGMTGSKENEATNEPCSPLDHAVAMWAYAGHQACKEVHVDLLKAKIMKIWGSQMDKTADAVIEAMGIQWRATLAQGKAKENLKQKMGQIFNEQKK